MKAEVVEKLMDRLDQIEPGEIQSLFARLVREKGFLRKVFEALHEGVILLDEDGVILFMNEAAGVFFGVEASKVGGKPLREVVSGFDEDFAVGSLQSQSRDLEVFYPQHRFLNCYVAGVQEGEGQREGYVILLRDLTRRREELEAEAESEKLNALTLLAAGVAHEIGNPLNSLSLHLQLLERRVRALEAPQRVELEGHLQTAQTEIARLDIILRQFLEAVRPSVPEREPVELPELVRRTLEVMGPELEDREVEVEVDFEGDFPVLELDATRLQQAFFNVLRNGFQALPSRGGKLRVEGRSTDYEVVISIEDNGSGISPEVMGSLFEPFQSTKPKGTGLGLLIVRRIVREHGGLLEVESEEGVGTKVTMAFPLAEKRVRLLEGVRGPIEV